MSTRESKTWAAAMAVVAALAGAIAPSAHAGDYHWIGAGTGGNMATDPADLTTQWNNLANWQEGAPPGPSDTARLALSNAGYVNAQSATLNALGLAGTTLDGALHIGEGVNLGISAGFIAGLYAQGRVVQSGGNVTVGGWLEAGYGSGSSGSYLLENGTLTVQQWEYIGWLCNGTFTQTGGNHRVMGEVSIGTPDASARGVMNLSGGTFRAYSLTVAAGYSQGALSLLSQTVHLEVDYELLLGLGATLTAVPGSEIHLRGTRFLIGPTDEQALGGLENIRLIFEGTGTLLGGTFEVAGMDYGAVPEGFRDNFTLGALVLGEGGPRWLSLEDKVDNGNRRPVEALYVHDIEVGPGSTLLTNGLRVYYDGMLVNQGTIEGGTPIFVPEPATFLLVSLGLGAIFLRRRRIRHRSRSWPARP